MGVRGAILAGGAATRFGGRPKGLERVGGVRMLDRVAAVLADATGAPPVIVSSAPEARSWRRDLEVVADALPIRGALVALYSAVCGAPAPVLVLGWDMPFVPASLLRELIEKSADRDAFLPASEGPREIEPFCAVYRPGCAGAMRVRIEAGDLRAVAFHPAVSVGILPVATVARHGQPGRIFFNVNTPRDLERAEEMCRDRA
jgi:molybdopterin-guanine dinucleotide biosynthesis protein A